MAKVKTVKIDGEEIYIFNSAIYIFESSKGYSLELGMIISEIVEQKYKKEENLFVEIELEDGREIHMIMHTGGVNGKLPQLQLYGELDDPEDYPNLMRVNENQADFPDIEKGISIEDIRKVEMPDVKVKLTATLPIDQSEWLKSLKKDKLNDILKEMIYEYWEKQETD
ncbi:hypothetical protein JOC77_001463 [Peribacillus deserti]|uniref:Uncharacterized protein n=1 Tax=Peribacillus deserti TaxID=673318 RepID=A0ABS2QIB3_9BACI|nr:hypothetical protein [Peribacillus deserti]MBM7692036.1 hypothetical protein [Peribacillus deserti]